MTIPTEVVAPVLTVVGGAIVAAIGFVYRQLTHINSRLARIEERLGITVRSYEYTDQPE